jgi:hypothetical protein
VTWPPTAGDGVAGETDDPLDQIGVVGLLQGRPAEDHDVAPVDGVEVVAQLVHHDAVTDLEGGQHRARRDVEHLGHIGADADGEHQGDTTTASHSRAHLLRLGPASEGTLGGVSQGGHCS